jgi:hypothetical protein
MVNKEDFGEREYSFIGHGHLGGAGFGDDNALMLLLDMTLSFV